MLALLALLVAPTAAPFTSDHWDLSAARVVEHLGRQALQGNAALNDAVFTAPGRNIADFDYVPEKKLLLVPTFLDDRVEAYTLE